MPKYKSAAKRLRISKKQRARNRAERSRIKTTIKKLRAATDIESAKELLSEVTSLLDKAVRKRIIHMNEAARRKSRLTKYVNKLQTSEK